MGSDGVCCCMCCCGLGGGRGGDGQLVCTVGVTECELVSAGVDTWLVEGDSVDSVTSCVVCSDDTLVNSSLYILRKPRRSSSPPITRLNVDALRGGMECDDKEAQITTSNNAG